MLRVSIERNRARSFKAALETLQETTGQLLKRMDYELLDIDGMTDTEVDKMSEQVGDSTDLISVFDDALSEIAIERNAFIKQNNLELSELTLKWKEQS